MISEENFHLLVGTTIKYCQCIENDVKLIFAGMNQGSLETNLENIRTETLGSVIKMMKELDLSSDTPYFSRNDYRLLYDITGTRNYWAHQGYLDYVYSPEENFLTQYDKLYADNLRLETLHKRVENVRLEFFGFSPKS